ncbi:MAG: TetR/AcrR family transcriptional regulator [Treponema sp.]|nr:TetR/AcrR family transcriptional regulator [Treponema sp.]
MKVSVTKQKILEVAEKEFLEKGFTKATLRDIVKKAGVTVGAFYGYYTSKEEIFDDLVKEAADGLVSIHKSGLAEFKRYILEGNVEAFDSRSLEVFKELYEFVYAHINSFRLIINCSSETKYENYIDNLSNSEVNEVQELAEDFEKKGSLCNRISSITESVLVTGGYTAFFCLILKGKGREETFKSVMELYNFCKAGWHSIFDLNIFSKEQ